jgi:predicted type IV restriction endonuclease
MMQELLQKIAARLQAGAYVNEAAVRIGIIEPILANLGWDTTDPLAVVPELTSEGRRVDYALCAYPSRPSVFIEAKAVGRVEAADRQLFEYAFHQGVPFAILTDGRTWSFYLPAAQGSYEDRRLYKLDLQERAPQECQRVFERYLSFGRLKSGEAQNDAQRDYASKASERIAADTLGKAWRELLNEPDPLLIELLIERTEALCGIRPPLEAGEAFILEQSATATPSSPSTHLVAQVTTSRPSESPVEKQSVRQVIATFQGSKVGGKGAAAAFLEVLRILATKFPDRMEHVAAAAKGRSRNHIAKSSGQVYPDRPDLMHTVVELIPGWFVGTNIANREKLRIVKGACEACGLQFGRDVTFEIPNA